MVPINPPLAGYEEVKPRLLEMKAEAQEGLGMVSSHISTHIHFSSLLLLRRSKLPKSLPTAGLAEQTVPS